MKGKRGGQDYRTDGLVERSARVTNESISGKAMAVHRSRSPLLFLSSSLPGSCLYVLCQAIVLLRFGGNKVNRTDHVVNVAPALVKRGGRTACIQAKHRTAILFDEEQ